MLLNVFYVQQILKNKLGNYIGERRLKNYEKFNTR